MAEKELRRMSRPELIEIIYALKSNEESLQKKNAIVRFRFQRQALLQRLFSTAQAAADDYLTSIKAANVSMEEEQKAAEKEQMLNGADE